jgi:hypothetical protein
MFTRLLPAYGFISDVGSTPCVMARAMTPAPRRPAFSGGLPFPAQCRMRVWSGILSVFLPLAVLTSTAQALELQPGLWEVTRKVEGEGRAPTASTLRKCVTPATAKMYSEQAFPKIGTTLRGRNCTVKVLAATDRESSWTMQCSSTFPLEQSVRFGTDGKDRYWSEARSSVKMPDKTLVVTSTVEARRLGECGK